MASTNKAPLSFEEPIPISGNSPYGVPQGQSQPYTEPPYQPQPPPQQSSSSRTGPEPPTSYNDSSYNRPPPNDSSYNRPPPNDASYNRPPPNDASYSRPPPNDPYEYGPPPAPQTNTGNFNTYSGRPPMSESGLSYGPLPPPANLPNGQSGPVRVTDQDERLPLMSGANKPIGTLTAPLQGGQPLSSTGTKSNLRDAKTATESALREYMELLRRRKNNDGVGIEEHLRIQSSIVLSHLRALRADVSGVVKDAESHRWRRFLIGGAIASFIPIVKALFPRPKKERDYGTSSHTEYAFRKSKSLISRILDATSRPGIATVAFFVFAVLFVFQNEVSLQVAKSVGKRLRRLASKVERRDEQITEEDVKLLQGWRWRVLMWS